jgi:hypothetical protein
MKGEDGFSKGVWIDLPGNFIPEVFLPLVVVKKIPNWEGDVCVVVFFVLLEEDIPPSSIEVPARHGCQRVSMGLS